MGVAASAASLPPEAVTPDDPPAKENIQHGTIEDVPQEAAAPADPPAKEDIQLQHGAVADAPQEAAAPADPPAKEEIQSAASAAADASGGKAVGERVVLDAEAVEEEEDEDCPFCVYMKGGGCGEEFVRWDKCVEEAMAEGSEVIERCSELLAATKRCMENYPEYYPPFPWPCIRPDEQDDIAAEQLLN
jgi:hypothetical protein